ncbi:MFS transporter [Phytohabitans suffuscus]
MTQVTAIGVGPEGPGPEGPAPEGSAPEGTAWANRDFRRLWLGSAVSSFGSEVAELALPLLALVTLSASAAEVGLLRVAQFLPFLLATLPLGVLVDRHRRRRLSFMVGADLGRFALLAVIPLGIWAGVARVELLYVVVFAAGILTVLYQIADFAFLPSLVRTDQLVDANGKIAATQSANEIGGRGLGGLIVQAASAPVAVAVNAVAFLVSALSLRRIRIERTDTEPTDTERTDTGPADLAGDAGERRPARAGGPWSETVEGLRAALGNRYVRALLGEATTFNLFNEMFILGLMLYAVRGLDIGAATIGLVFTAGGVGSFAGAWFGSRIAGRFGYGRVLLVTLVLGNTAPVGVLLVGPAGAAAPALLCAVFVVMGAGIGIANVHAVSLRQTALPERLRGRVNAAYRLISWGAVPVGAAIGGVVATQAGAWAAMATGAVGIATATLWVGFSAVPRLARIADAGSPAPDGR